jgi:CopG family nickel-responsive transcriptional regulator
MSTLYRFGVSLEKSLIDAFDRMIGDEQYPNRSEAIRDLIREKLVRKGLGDDRKIAGAIVMTYDHHKRDLAERLMDIQHDFFANIISTQHVHLDHDSCLEIIAVRGKARDIGLLASRLKALIGVAHLEVSVSSYGLVGDEDAHDHTGDAHGHRHT